MSLRHAKKHHSKGMGVSLRGAAAVARFEGFRSKPYRDAVGVWTIGYGHTKNVGPNTKPWSRKHALSVLRSELNGAYATPVRNLDLMLTQNQFDALVSFAYNLGPGALAPDTGIGRALRRKDWKQAGQEMLRWDRAGGRRLLGLTRRREAERRRFLRRL